MSFNHYDDHMPNLSEVKTGRHQFEALSRKIVGPVIEFHRVCTWILGDHIQGRFKIGLLLNFTKSTLDIKRLCYQFS